MTPPEVLGNVLSCIFFFIFIILPLIVHIGREIEDAHILDIFAACLASLRERFKWLS